MVANEATARTLASLLTTAGSVVSGYRVAAVARTPGGLWNSLLVKDGVFHSLLVRDEEIVATFEKGPGRALFRTFADKAAAMRDFSRDIHQED